MTIRLLDLDFGKDTAESDGNLADYFVASAGYSRIPLTARKDHADTPIPTPTPASSGLIGPLSALLTKCVRFGPPSGLAWKLTNREAANGTRWICKAVRCS
jgi:hypothetical protein